MKTSNIIIIAYVVAILIGMTVLFSSSTKHASSQQITNIHSKGFELPPINVIVAMEGSDIHVHKADFDSIHIEIEADSIDGRQFFHVSNDTVFAHEGARMYVKCQHPRSVIGRNAYWIGLGEIESDSIYLDISGGEFQMNYNGHGSTFKQLSLQADSALIKLRNANITQLDIKASNQSKVEATGEYEKVSVVLNNASNFTIDKNPKTLYLESHD